MNSSTAPPLPPPCLPLLPASPSSLPLPPPCLSLLPQLSWQLLPKPPPPPHSLLSFLLIFFQWTQKCRPHRNEGVLNSSSPLMPVPSCLHSSIKRLPSSARNLLVVPDLLWFDLFSACLCNSLKPGFPFSEQNADLFGKSIISPVYSCSTSEQELNWAQPSNKFTAFPSAHPYPPSSNAYFWVWVVGRWGIARSGNASMDGSESPGIPVFL